MHLSARGLLELEDLPSLLIPKSTRLLNTRLKRESIKSLTIPYFIINLSLNAR
jgi:hypothetical protein